MIYITKLTTKLRIPRIKSGYANRLLLVNQTTKAQYQVIFIDTDCGYYDIDITTITPTMDNGQYDYYIMGDADVYATGILQYGDYESDIPSQHKFEPTIEIKQFEPK